MRTSILPAAAAIALLSAAPVFAQTNQPAPAEPQAAAGDDVAPLDPNRPAVGDTVGNPANAAADAVVSTQADGEILARDVIGLDVVDPQGNEIGSVDDLLFNPEGRISAAVIGAGGVLGIGEKKVAVNWDALEYDLANEMVVAHLSAEDLEALPEFRSLQQVMLEEKSEAASVVEEPAMPADEEPMAE